MSMTDEKDTIDIAAVKKADRLDEDGGEGSDATEDGLDDDLSDVYENPGEIVTESLA
jgi:hypothetical protein